MPDIRIEVGTNLKAVLEKALHYQFHMDNDINIDDLLNGLAKIILAQRLKEVNDETGPE